MARWICIGAGERQCPGPDLCGAQLKEPFKNVLSAYVGAVFPMVECGGGNGDGSGGGSGGGGGGGGFSGGGGGCGGGGGGSDG